jgi:hypothetical protein
MATRYRGKLSREELRALPFAGAEVLKANELDTFFQ